MAGEFTKPSSVVPFVAGTIAKASTMNANFAALGKDSYTGFDEDGTFQDNDLGDETLSTNGILVADAKVREGKDLKIYDASGNLLNTIPWADLVNVLDFTITSFADLSSGSYTTGNYHIATVTTGIFTANYIYLKITTGSGWSEIVPFTKQQIYSVTDNAMMWWNGSAWIFVMDIEDDPICKAWGKFNGSTGAILDSYNVSGVVRNSAGWYDVSFTNNMPDANYVVLIGGYVTTKGSTSARVAPHTYNPAVGSFDIVNEMNGQFSIQDLDFCSFAVFSTF